MKTSPGPGRPFSTRSSTTKPIRFRVTKEERKMLEKVAKQLKLSSPDLAAKFFMTTGLKQRLLDLTSV
jgi:hypothetical protein